MLQNTVVYYLKGVFLSFDYKSIQKTVFWNAACLAVFFMSHLPKLHHSHLEWHSKHFKNRYKEALVVLDKIYWISVNVSLNVFRNLANHAWSIWMKTLCGIYFSPKNILPNCQTNKPPNGTHSFGWKEIEFWQNSCIRFG